MKGTEDNYRTISSIWKMALGYFIFYIPYSALVKAKSSGLLERNDILGLSSTQVNGYQLLPIVLIGTVITMPLILMSLGWYRYMGRRRVLGITIPFPQRWAIFSGIGFAAIIATTTLLYTIEGVSIILALLLMRGGVLIMSPVIDRIFNRPVHWYAWTGLGLSLLAVIIALAQIPEYNTTGLIVILLVYLTGYMFRLQYMTNCAKDINEDLNRRFFVEENSVAMVTLILVPAAMAYFGIGEAGLEMRSGIAAIIQGEGIWLGLSIGVFYGFLGIFGSLIYLNRRENTLAIPINRCASLLSGLVATLILFISLDGDGVSVTQLISATIILFALVLMSVFDIRHMKGKDNHNPMQRVFLFICDTNLTSSPIAAAICNEEIRKHLELDSEVNAQSSIYARSAGLALPSQRQLPKQVKDALVALTVPVPDHQANQVNSYGMHRAEKVICMNVEQKEELIKKFPWSREKIIQLDKEADLMEPQAASDIHYHEFALNLQQRISNWLKDSGQILPASGKEWVQTPDSGT